MDLIMKQFSVAVLEIEMRSRKKLEFVFRSKYQNYKITKR